VKRIKSADVLAWINRQSESFETAELAGRFGMSVSAAQGMLSRMLKRGDICRVEGVARNLFRRLPIEQRPWPKE